MIDPHAEPRIAPVPREPGRQTLNIFGTLAHNPDLARAFYGLGGHLLQHGSLPARERELVILRTGYRSGAEYEFAHHRALGTDAGLTNDEITAAADVGDHPWGASDQALIDLVDEICAHSQVSATTWATLRRDHADPDLLELLVLVGFYRLVSGVLNGVGVAIEPGLVGWPPGATVGFCAPRDPQT